MQNIPIFLNSLEYLSLGLQPTIEPVEEGSLPKYAILRLQHPVVLIGIDQQFSWYASHDGCIESRHGLVGQDAVVALAVDAEDRCIPLIHKQMWRAGVSLLGNLVLLVPVWATQIPVHEPFLLCLEILHVDIEDTIVGNECLETLVMIACQPID